MRTVKAMLWVVLVFFLLIAGRTQLCAQWVYSNGPCDGEVLALVVHDTCVFASTRVGGVWRSTNNGVNWMTVNNGLPENVKVQTLAVKDSSVFAAGVNGGPMYRTTNDGQSWQVMTNIWMDDAPFIIVTDSIIYVSGAMGISRSTDDGLSFEEIGASMRENRVQALAVRGTDLFVGTYRGTFTSTDNGASWTPINDGLPAWFHISALAVVDDNVFGLILDSGIYRLRDSDNQWIRVNNDTSFGRILSITTHEHTLCVGATGGVYISTDLGETWTSSSAGITYWQRIIGFAFSSAYVYAGGGDGKIYRSSDDGVTWEWPNSGLTTNQITAIAGTDNMVFAGGETRGIFRSMDNGVRWTSVNKKLLQLSFIVFDAATTSLYVGSLMDGIHRSSDSGNTWTPLNSGLGDLSVTDFAIVNANLYVSNYEGLFRSTDGGENWKKISGELLASLVNCFVVSDSTLFVGTWQGMFISIDDGVSWNSANQGFIYQPYVSDLLVTEYGLLAGTSYGLYFSSDNGTNWTAISGISSPADEYSLTNSGTTVFAGTEGSGVCVVDTNNASWIQVNENLKSKVYVRSLAVVGSNLYAGVYGYGVVRRPLSEFTMESIDSLRHFTSVRDSSDHNTTTAPSQDPSLISYPNPFSDNTTIVFTLQKPEIITLNIYSITGERVTTLLEESRDTGTHSILWDARGLAGGMYFVQMQSGWETRTHSLIR